MKRFLINICIMIIVIASIDTLAQRSDPTLRRIGYHTGNRVGISFYNDGQIAGFSLGVDIRGEWPLGSGNNYIGDMTPLIGLEFINTLGDTLQSVTISRGPRSGQGDKRHPSLGYFWGFNPVPGYMNPNYESLAMSHLPDSWPLGGWRDQPTYVDDEGKTQWNGYFGRGITNADQESYFIADDQWFDKFNSNFLPDSLDQTRKGMGLTMKVRGFQWASFLAEDVLFWLYDITNEGTTLYRKAVFGTIVGGVVGGDGDSDDDLAYFDITESITYTWDSDGVGNRGQRVGYCGYAFLESPGNPFDGIDNDGSSVDPNSPRFLKTNFDPVIYNAGDRVVLINPDTYERTLHTVQGPVDTVYSMGVRFIIVAGVTEFREGHIDRIVNGVAIPHPSAYDGIDNNLNGLIDENEAVHYTTWITRGELGLAYINYVTGEGKNDPHIDERRDNDAGQIITSWQRLPGGTIGLVTHWSGDENANWDPQVDDVGSDGIGPEDDGYPGPDPDGTEGNGRPDQGEPNFGILDPEESDQIGLTSFNFFNIAASPNMSDDALLWSRMFPGRFDVIPPIPQDGDFIYGSGYFPLSPNQTERFSIAVLFGDDFSDIVRNKIVVQQIYNAGYRFPQPPRKPKITISQDDGKVVIYWDGRPTEDSKDFITKKKDFQGYKIYRATDANFRDARSITNAFGSLSFDKPIAQYDLVDSIQGFFYPSPELLEQVGGTTFNLGTNTGIVNRFVDSNLVKGVTYYYAVTAYDEGDAQLNIFPAENTKFIFRTSTGEIIIDDNTGYITPGARPIGYSSSNASALERLPGFRASGTGSVQIIDDAEVKDSYKYRIVFQDSALQRYTKNWSLIDLVSPDTIYIPATGNTILVPPNETVEVPKGIEIFINSTAITLDTNIYTASYDTLIVRDSVFAGETKIVHGFRVQLYNNEEIVIDRNNSSFVDVLDTLTLPIIIFEPYFRTATGPASANNGIRVPYDYQVEFFDSPVAMSVADTVLRVNPPHTNIIFPALPVNFKVKNLTNNEYIDFAYSITGTQSSTHSIWFKEDVSGEYKRTWRITLQYNRITGTEPQGLLNLYTLKPFSSDDIFEFSVTGPSINKNLAGNQLDKIKVVPNPYVVTHEGEPSLLSTQTSGRGERSIRFTHVPPGSKISIFTVRGELVKTLYHEELFVGDIKWNLRTEENLDAAFGVYVFYLDAPGIGKKTGKFALIK